MTPIVFDGHFGLIHEAPGDCAVVMCAAMGHEQLCASRGWRELADRIASLGYPVLRFDWSGCGDSLGEDMDPERLAAWTASLTAAVSAARARFQVQRVVLLGLRFGGTLAALNAEALGAEALILLAPAITGRAHVRELSAMGGLGAVAEDKPESGIDVVGFRMSDETIASINPIDLRKLVRTPAGKVLLVTPPGQFNADALEVSLQALGAEVTHLPFDGYSEYLGEITLSQPPRSVFDQLTAWLAQAAPVTAKGLTQIGATGRLETETFAEEPIVFGGAKALLGLHCIPTNPDPDRTVVIVMNTGLNPHIGWARLGVLFARRYAAKGIASFRIDVAGIGDSAPLPGRAALPMYDADLCADVMDAITCMKEKGYERMILFGTCSGAYLAFHSGLADQRVNGLILVNLAKFIWRQDYKVTLTQPVKNSSFYAGRILQVNTWLRLVRGELNLAGVLPELTARVLKKLRSSVQDAVRSVYVADDDTSKIYTWFRQLTGRKVPVLMAYSDHDAGRDELAVHFGTDGKRLKRRAEVEIATLGQSDHSITSARARELLFANISNFLNLAART